MIVTITVALAAVAVLAAIVVVAVGGGGELSAEHPDHPPLSLPARRPVGGTDAALLRLPLGVWGYHKQITDEALHRFAQELTERDTRIAVLEQELAEARQRLGEDPRRNGGPRALPAARAPRTDGLAETSATRTDGRAEALAPNPDPFGASTSGGFATRTDRAEPESGGYVPRRAKPPEAEGSDDAPASDGATDVTITDSSAEPRPATGEGR